MQRGPSQEHPCASPDPPQSCTHEGLKSDPEAAELLPPGLVDVSRTVARQRPRTTHRLQSPADACCASEGSRSGVLPKALRYRQAGEAQGPLPPCSLEEEMSETMKSCGSRRSISAGELQGSHRTILKELQETQQVLHLLTALQASGVQATSPLWTHCHPVPEGPLQIYYGMKFPSLLQETS